MGSGPEARCADCLRVAHCRSLSSSGLQKEPILPVIRTYTSSLQKEPIHAEMVDVVQGPAGESGA